jgi:hypothetical protein
MFPCRGKIPALGTHVISDIYCVGQACLTLTPQRFTDHPGGMLTISVQCIPYNFLPNIYELHISHIGL